MRPDSPTPRPSESASQLLQEAETYLEAVRDFKEGYEENLKEAHRHCLLDEIDKTNQILTASLEREKLKEEDAWAYLRNMGSNMYIFLATDVSPTNRQVRIPLPRFRKICNDLKESIAQGSLDERLSLAKGSFPTAAGLILERLSADQQEENDISNAS